MTDETSFTNMDSYRGGSDKFGLTFKQIVIMHINRCVMNGSVEWSGGYWNETGNNPITKSYVPSTRAVYYNSVKMLRACLRGYFDEKMTEANTQLDKEFAITKKEYEENYDKALENKQKKSDLQEDFRLYTIEWHIRLFEELIMLSKRLNFFQEETSEESV